MSRKGRFTVVENTPIAKGIWRLYLKGDATAITRPGQFVNIQVPGFFLRRPISVCNYSSSSLTLIYKVFGRGTARLSTVGVGEELDLLCGLGNGFNTHVSTLRPLLVGGGVGVPPLYRLCLELLSQGASPTVVLGFNTASEAFYSEEFARLGASVHLCTADGSIGFRGLVTDLIREKEPEADYLFACGPSPMLKALQGLALPGQLSFEERMGCGFGGCMGCTHKTTAGYKRICLEGPVLLKEEVIW